jgi:hypothetical protein
VCVKWPGIVVSAADGSATQRVTQVVAGVCGVAVMWPGGVAVIAADVEATQRLTQLMAQRRNV